MTIDGEENKRPVEYWANEAVREEYVARVKDRRIGWLIEALDRAVDGLDKSSKIFEFGSGSGEDAKYLRGLGYQIETSDVSQDFVDLLRDSGFKAKQFDALAGRFPEGRDLILAGFVLQHFTPRQVEAVVAKVFGSLHSGGRFVFTIAGGKGEGWLTDAGGHSFYWCRWSQDSLCRVLEKVGFPQADISMHPGRNRSCWLSAFVEKG